jgi:hypothetical protein
MRLQDQITEIAAKSNHREIGVVTTASQAKAIEFAKRLASSLIELHVLKGQSSIPKTRVENLKIGKAIDKGEGRYKATCEVIVDTQAETTFYVIILISKREMRRRVEKAVGTTVNWQPRELAAKAVPPDETHPETAEEIEPDTEA